MMAVKLCRSGPPAAATEAGQFTGVPLFGGEVLFIEGERWLDAERWWAGATMAAAIVIRPINIAAQAATMVAEFIAGAQSSEGALLCAAELQSVGGVRMLPIVVDAVLPIVVVVDADGKHTGRASAAGTGLDQDRSDAGLGIDFRLCPTSAIHSDRGWQSAPPTSR
jgi:hypothetical protein